MNAGPGRNCLQDDCLKGFEDRDHTHARARLAGRTHHSFICNRSVRSLLARRSEQSSPADVPVKGKQITVRSTAQMVVWQKHTHLRIIRADVQPSVTSRNRSEGECTVCLIQSRFSFRFCKDNVSRSARSALLSRRDLPRIVHPDDFCGGVRISECSVNLPRCAATSRLVWPPLHENVEHHLPQVAVPAKSDSNAHRSCNNNPGQTAPHSIHGYQV